MSDWEIEKNQWGGVRRYRWVQDGYYKKIKEYEMQVHTTNRGDVWQSEIDKLSEEEEEDE